MLRSEPLYLYAQDVVHYVAEEFGVGYGVRGIAPPLGCLALVYKRPMLILGKADDAVREELPRKYEKS